MPRAGLLMFLVLIRSLAAAQEMFRPASGVRQDTIRAISLSFNRLLNTFLWNGSFAFSGQSSAADFRINQNVQSRVIRTEQISIQDEYEGTIDLGTRLDGPWQTEAMIHSNVLSDSRAIGLTQLSQHQVMGGLTLKSNDRSLVSALGGVEFNSQENERDHGFAYLLRAGAERIAFEEIQSSINASWSQSFLGRRKPDHSSVAFALYREFAPGTDDSLTVSYDKLRREFYVAADPFIQSQFQVNSNIFTRVAEAVDVSNYLTYRLNDNASMGLRGGISKRTIDRGLQYQSPGSTIADAHIEESQIYGSFQLNYNVPGVVQTDVNILHAEKEESHSTRFLNNISQRTSLMANVSSDLSNDDLVKIGGSASILRYDTPDTLNTDDRDELFLTLGIEETHRFSRFLTLTLEADVVLNHLVYLHRSQSANNAWNRVLRFGSRVYYGPTPWFRSTNSAEVLANYTVFDFEEQVASIRSYSFRQASWSDSTVLRLGRDIECMFLGGIRLYERGLLRWSEFKERPENYFVEKNFWPQIVLLSGPQLRFGLGFRYFSQDRYVYAGSERVLDLELQTSGPTANIEWYGSNRERVVLEGWRETQTVNGVLITSISNLSIRVFLGI